MLCQRAISAFLIFLLFQAAISYTLSLGALDACSENSLQFADSNIAAATVDLIKTKIIQDYETKQVLLDNSFEMEKAKQKLLKCTEELMKKNQFRVLEKFVEEVLDPLNLDLSTEMRLVGNQIKREIDNIVNLAHAKRNTQTITPVFQWIQSKSNVFIQIKFAHRHDAPGCLEVRNEKVEFAQNGFFFSAFGVQAQQPIQFLLNLTFYKDIIPEQCSWNLESVGRMFINVTKATPEVWVSILKNNEKLPQMRLWWEMKDVYKDAMKEYDILVEKEEERESEGKRRRRGRKSEDSSSLEPESADEKQAEQQDTLEEL